MELLYKLFRSNFVLLTVDISNSRNYFFTSNIFGGIINNSSWSKNVIRSQMTLSINHCGYPALLYFALITLIPMSNLMLFFWIYANPLKWCFADIFLKKCFTNPRYSFLIFFSICLCLKLHLHCSKWFLYLKTFQDLLL